MQWKRIPSPGKMTGGGTWTGNRGSMRYVIAKSGDRYYLTACLGLFGEVLSYGAFNSLADAKDFAIL